jgi:hypothetical protein
LITLLITFNSPHMLSRTMGTVIVGDCLLRRFLGIWLSIVGWEFRPDTDLQGSIVVTCIGSVGF